MLSILSFTFIHAEAQTRDLAEGIAFTGVVKDHQDGSLIPRGTITLMDVEDTTFQVDLSIRNGKYDMILPYDRSLLVQFEAPGHIPRSIEANTNGVPLKQQKRGFAMIMHVVLFEPVEGVDHSVLSEPFGRVSYIAQKKTFEWDMEYVKRMKGPQQRFLDEYELRRKELETR
jgi:hypothetical protein